MWCVGGSKTIFTQKRFVFKTGRNIKVADPAKLRKSFLCRVVYTLNALLYHRDLNNQFGINWQLGLFSRPLTVFFEKGIVSNWT